MFQPIPNIDEVIKRSKIHPSRVKNVYIFGSRVYGCCTEKSDWDFIMVANTSISNQEIRSGDFNIHVMTMDNFKSCLKEHKSSQVEAFLTPDKFRLMETEKIDWTPNISSLRHSFSHTSSSSWVKSRKKIEQGDYHIGIKSMFHSLRIPMFGIQIAKTCKINNFSEANWINDKIMSKTWKWSELDSEFREVRNKILSDFRSVTTKGY